MNKKYPDNVLDPKIYDKARQIANDTYKRHSAYKSMFISTTYKKLGGRYSTPPKTSRQKQKNGTSRWIKEKWIQVIPYLTNKKLVACGALNDNGGSKYKKKVCRPFVRVNKNTPITYPNC